MSPNAREKSTDAMRPPVGVCTLMSRPNRLVGMSPRLFAMVVSPGTRGGVRGIASLGSSTDGGGGSCITSLSRVCVEIGRSEAQLTAAAGAAQSTA
eukprot:CAMPEP_0185508066 /NCGR_PEP_ID=MMETSP1366-20130426/43623_1 /TAXON_ID=38817 /ORGANISM="Gephyrocapsa oceanica, Strain RCC1303" /LENGTH=95 /DNA_ID=CAMNT_0028118389 /DNA_START=102 /DNA_END=385 /DNA_ORIENTATION=-